MCVVTFDWEKNDAIEKFKTFNKKKSISWAVMEVTEACNFSCKWCYANAGNNQGNGKYLKLEKAKILIKTLSDIGVKQITFSGGEPTLYPHLTDLVKYAKDYGLIIHMNTNGYYLNKSRAKELYKSGLTQIQTNIDSLDKNKHDKVRGKKGSFERTVKALYNAMEVGLTCVSQTVLTKENEKEILDIFKFARSIGIQRCRVWDMAPSDGIAKDNFYLKPTDYISTLKKLYEFAVSTGATNIESADPLFPGELKTELKISGGFCVAMAGLVLIISTHGDVYFCCAKRDPMYNIFDNLETGSIDEFHKMKLKEHYNKFYKYPSNCIGCHSFKKCRGGCVIRREYSEENKDYWCNKFNIGIKPLIIPA